MIVLLLQCIWKLFHYDVDYHGGDSGFTGRAGIRISVGNRFLRMRVVERLPY
jgi:hypothetical protein